MTLSIVPTEFQVTVSRENETRGYIFVWEEQIAILVFGLPLQTKSVLCAYGEYAKPRNKY